eukprot:COSAG06_NODE_64_length_26790_cov_7.462291_23_plen_78_part_00
MPGGGVQTFLVLTFQMKTIVSPYILGTTASFKCQTCPSCKDLTRGSAACPHLLAAWVAFLGHRSYPGMTCGLAIVPG